MNKVKNILVLQSRIEILVTVPGLGHGVPVCGFHTRPRYKQDNPVHHKNRDYFTPEPFHSLETNEGIL